MNIISHLKYLHEHRVEGFPLQPINVEEAEEHVCKNCQTLYRGNFCPCCGQSAKTERFAHSGIIRTLIEELTHFDSKMLRTIQELFYRPGYMISDYVHCKRANYYKPVALLTTLVGLYLLLSLAFSPETISGSLDSLGNEILEIPKEPMFANLTMVASLCKYLANLAHNYLVLKFYAIFIAVIVYKPVFNLTRIGRETNLAEHFYIRVNLVNMAMIIDLLAFFPTLLSTGSATSISGIWCTLPLGIWIYKQFFQISWWKSILLNIIAYILSLILFIAIVAALIFTTAGLNQLLLQFS